MTVHLRPMGWGVIQAKSRENGVSESGNSACKGPEVGKKHGFCWKQLKKARVAGIGAQEKGVWWGHGGRREPDHARTCIKGFVFYPKCSLNCGRVLSKEAMIVVKFLYRRGWAEGIYLEGGVGQEFSGKQAWIALDLKLRKYSLFVWKKMGWGDGDLGRRATLSHLWTLALPGGGHRPMYINRVLSQAKPNSQPRRIRMGWVSWMESDSKVGEVGIVT